jgi:endoglucanase
MNRKYKLMFVSLLLSVLLPGMSIWTQNANLAEALQKSIYFYDAEKCGPGVTGGRLEWRGDCHTTDKFPGGFHDAGDHVKFGLPQSYAASTLAWGVYEFKDAYVAIGEYGHVMEILRWFSDYFLSCWNGTRFVYQVGEGNQDHNYWGPPELQKEENQARNVYGTDTNPGSDQASQAAAALAIMSMILKTEDATYATKCLDTAKALYAHARAKRGLGYDGGFYNSSYDEDQMSWGAVWLYIATQTKSYLDDILSVDTSGNYTGYLKKIVINPTDDWQNIWVHSWDTVWGGVFAKLAPITNDPQHWWFYRWNIEYWAAIPHEDTGDTNFLARSPAGYAFLNGWGSARYNAAAQLQCLVYRKDTGDARFADWAKGQMEYLLGNNPLGLSYEVGYGSKYPQHPHHRAAHGSTTNSPDNPPNMKHTLWGALVGGPDLKDQHNDDIWDYIYNEVSIDYNAAFVGALAGLYHFYGSTSMQPVANFPPAEPPIDEYLIRAKLEQEGTARTQVTIQVDVQPVHPPRYEKGVSARYFFDISELVAAGQSISDITVDTYYDESKATYGVPAKLNGPTLVSGTLYYIEVDWSAAGLFGSREYQFGLIAAQDSSYTYHWDPTNDPSRTGLVKEYSSVTNIPIYLNGTKIYGTEPGGTTTNPPTAVPTATPTGPTAVPTATPSATPATSCALPGDVNSTGTVDIVDALLCAQYYVGLTPANFNSACADVNCSGTIDIIDALRIAQYYVGLLGNLICV